MHVNSTQAEVLHIDCDITGSVCVGFMLPRVMIAP